VHYLWSLPAACCAAVVDDSPESAPIVREAAADDMSVIRLRVGVDAAANVVGRGPCRSRVLGLLPTGADAALHMDMHVGLSGSPPPIVGNEHVALRCHRDRWQVPRKAARTVQLKLARPRARDALAGPDRMVRLRRELLPGNHHAVRPWRAGDCRILMVAALRMRLANVDGRSGPAAGA
jgi:hypothetical protein